MLLAMVGGVYAVLAAREGLGGGLSMLAIGVKLTAGLVLPFALADGGHAGDRRRGRCSSRGGGVAGGARGPGLRRVRRRLVPHAGSRRQKPERGRLAGHPGLISSELGMPTVGHIAGFVLGGAFAARSAGWCGACGGARSTGSPVPGGRWWPCWSAPSSLLPWYVAWLLPLAALARDRRLGHAAIVFTGVVRRVTLLGYIPHGFL